MQKLRRNMNEGRSVARKLLDSKRQELKAGTPGKDIMSLLGLSLPSFPSIRGVIKDSSPSVKSSSHQRQDWGLTDEEIIGQVR